MEKIWWIVVSAVVAAVTIGIAIKLAEWAGLLARQTVENAIRQVAQLLGF